MGLSKAESMELNKLAVLAGCGSSQAMDKLFEKIDPILKGYAYSKKSSVVEFEDLFQEFRMIAFKMVDKFNTDYKHKEDSSFMALVFTSCTNRVSNIYTSHKAPKRSKFSETSLDLQLGGDGTRKTIAELVADTYSIPLDELVIGNVEGHKLNKKLEDFRTVSLRDYEIVKAIIEEVPTDELAHIVNKHSLKPKQVEFVEYDQNTRKTVSRARKNFKKFAGLETAC